ncbi:MAG TPA: hypothetical protein PLL95_12340, partial [Anaerolineales bacterium]|nr:hypothetical protein [Anaerolineales bacterium]
GKALKSLPMGLASRFRLQRSSIMALLTGIVFGVVTGWLSLSTAGIVIAVALATIFLPMQYTFTTKGIALGQGMFYPWSDFSGFTSKGSTLQFERSSVFGGLTVSIASTEVDTVLKYAERYIETR